SVVPGFTPSTKFMGMNEAWSAPGVGYILGIQPTNEWLDGLVSGPEQYITNHILLNQEVIRNRTQRIDATLDVEPFRDFKVTLTANKNFVENNFEFFKVREPGGNFEHLAPRDMGSYSVSYFSLNTFLRNDTAYVQQLFSTFENNREVISARLGDGRPHTDDGPEYNFG